MFDEQKRLDALYRDYGYALRVVQEMLTADDVNEARSLTVSLHINHELLMQGRPQVDPGLIQSAIKETFNMTTRKCNTADGERYLYFRR